MKKFVIKVFFLLSFFVSASAPILVFAADNTGSPNTSPLVNPSVGIKLDNPTTVTSICGLVQKILGFVISIGMPNAALFLAYGGFQFVLAQGNPKELGKAKTNLLNIFIGVFIFLAAWFLGQVIANTLRSITTSTSTPSSFGSCN